MIADGPTGGQRGARQKTALGAERGRRSSDENVGSPRGGHIGTGSTRRKRPSRQAGPAVAAARLRGCIITSRSRGKSVVVETDCRRTRHPPPALSQKGEGSEAARLRRVRVRGVAGRERRPIRRSRDAQHEAGLVAAPPRRSDSSASAGRPIPKSNMPMLLSHTARLRAYSPLVGSWATRSSRSLRALWCAPSARRLSPIISVSPPILL